MRTKRANFFIIVVIVALCAYAIVSIVRVRRTTEEAQENLIALQEEVSETEQENAALQYDIDHANDDSTLESIARDKLGLVTAGEKVYVDVNG